MNIMDFLHLKKMQRVKEIQVPIQCKTIDVTRAWKEGHDDEFSEICKLQLPKNNTLSKSEVLDAIAKKHFKESYYDIESLAEDGFEEYNDKYEKVQKIFYTDFERIDFWNVNSQRQKITESRYAEIKKV